MGCCVKKTFVFLGCNFEERWGRGPGRDRASPGAGRAERAIAWYLRSSSSVRRDNFGGTTGKTEGAGGFGDAPGRVRRGEVALGDQIFLHGEHVDSGRPLVQIALDGHIAPAGSGVGRGASAVRRAHRAHVDAPAVTQPGRSQRGDALESEGLLVPHRARLAREGGGRRERRHICPRAVCDSRTLPVFDVGFSF